LDASLQKSIRRKGLVGHPTERDGKSSEEIRVLRTKGECNGERGNRIRRWGALTESPRRVKKCLRGGGPANLQERKTKKDKLVGDSRLLEYISPH